MAVVEAEIVGGVGHIVLNRPEALNSLNGAMIEGIRTALDAWRDDDAVTSVLVTSSSPRAFCAGGDIKAIRQAVVDGDNEAGPAYFAAEYDLDELIANYPKPYIAVIEAAAFGGGLGISIHGSIRIVTENAVLAMPETAIGFVPDVGSSYFLSRLPGHVGRYLALTGTRISGSDALALGLATHFCPSDSIESMKADILAGIAVDEVLDRYTTAPSTTVLSFDAEAVAAVFEKESLVDIIDALVCDTPWSRTTKTQLATLSPTSLMATDALIARGADSTLRECLDRELRMATWIITEPDFAEGVRAVLVDKDRAPQWKPLVLEMVRPEAFQQLL
ncbi:enoyl-CoA hydratase/isomerase family protein [Rhodococcus sp. IEGM 1401]|uniref:enoyl-CoA hydratase/isomerase family protein n=1 Tax=unclassified Rhodococcus (in: high G+C Gram-positive bacteria) TaxID=192944 RepID=UPI0022B5B9F6|nr:MULTISPECIES: enoyl-CoA hydratase/isomerase family protein [unclassified Rhodococcus (in: high G+C Gram-positive bacteria)]MCZ4561024.1 enoyl-CoA hydratase/isomerase family protein [Rhodococcus sp. IEGM 1401]MDI9921070.1 enoyl-CoA hydratase/isomerase family protein [Rhodococcus sp. IEGM 1372]MDV8033523.1 enoyl-CoA hydratase/isomerase family protein [Rhodococcus sp. IEGM 1414]